MSDASTPILQVRDLEVVFRTGLDVIKAVNGVNLSVKKGETLAILGESGSGKSVTAAAIMRLLPSPPAEILAGEVHLNGEEVFAMGAQQWRARSGQAISMVFQDALMSLNPVRSIGHQVAEVFLAHNLCTSREAKQRAIALLDLVGIPGAAERAKDFPHQLSGGMRQRVMIAMAIALDPDVLIADEPTTALDVTVQAQIMNLLSELKARTGMAMILITHDLGVAAESADRIAVMYAGKIAEAGTTRDVLTNPRHPYTLALLGSAPSAQSSKGKLQVIDGSPPDLARLPHGCAFAPRCHYATRQCTEAAPPHQTLTAQRSVSCHHPVGTA
ncbi:MAG: ABC transporter ATP-binding protein [Gammaproteobacteria bacterium]|nr:ABC transporter ATP-binding protein [Gammaproteobacteria bacterium]